MDPNTQKLYVVMHEEKLQNAANRRHSSKSQKRSPGFLARLFSWLKKTRAKQDQHEAQPAAPMLRSTER